MNEQLKKIAETLERIRNSDVCWNCGDRAYEAFEELAEVIDKMTKVKEKRELMIGDSVIVLDDEDDCPYAGSHGTIVTRPFHNRFGVRILYPVAVRTEYFYDASELEYAGNDE